MERRYWLAGKQYTLLEASRRIAELEAELAEYREAASYGRDMKARAEKAEAEVERLQAEMQLHGACLSDSCSARWKASTVLEETMPRIRRANQQSARKERDDG